jgi:hypothetical protein
MTNEHLTDEEIQDHCLLNNGDELLDAHLMQCETCLARKRQYETMLNLIGGIGPEAFDFDVTELVLARLRTEKEKRSFVVPSIWMLLIISMVALGAIYYAKRKYFVFVYNIDTITTWFIISIAISVVLFIGWDMYRMYRAKMHLLSQE